MKKAVAFALAMVGSIVGALAGVVVTSVISMLLLLSPTAVIFLAMALGSAGAVLASNLFANTVLRLFNGK